MLSLAKVDFDLRLFLAKLPYKNLCKVEYKLKYRKIYNYA